MGGMTSVIANFHPRELWVGLIPHTPALTRLLQLARERNVNVTALRAGDTFGFGGAQIRILAPPSDAAPGAQVRNLDSMAMTIAMGKTAVLLEGDAEKKAEHLIAAQHPRADLLKVAHNGSATSTSPELLNAVAPQFAVISVGAHNHFGHPRRETLQRLGDAHIATYRTDLNGAVTFYLDGKNITPQPAVLR
jgi:competence protein ComEC